MIALLLLVLVLWFCWPLILGVLIAGVMLGGVWFILTLAALPIMGAYFWADARGYFNAGD